MRIILDAGALIAIDRRDRQVGAMLRVAQQERLAVRSSAGVVAQVWRDGSRQTNLSRVLSGVDVAALDLPIAKRVGRLLGRVDSSDVIDGHVAQLIEPGDQLLTSDPQDMRELLGDRARSVSVVTV
ncbi:hypothetical protein BH23ACT10_BH23ACT10_24710 [soil metagenome]